MSASIEQNKQRHITQDFNLHSHCRNNVSSHSFHLSAFQLNESYANQQKSSLFSAPRVSPVSLAFKGDAWGFLPLTFRFYSLILATINPAVCTHNTMLSEHFGTCCIKAYAVAQSQTTSLFSREWKRSQTMFASDANSWRVNHNAGRAFVTGCGK
jgi:hypothetical protein